MRAGTARIHPKRWGSSAPAGGGLVGDVDAIAVAGRAAALTPVPGGVGAVTTALLLAHTVEAATS